MQIFDKPQIKANFNKAHKSYNKAANLQKIVAKNLVNLAAADINKSSKILDLGCGTGFIANEIFLNFKNKEIFQLDIAWQMLKENPFKTPKITADIENLPFENNIFDLALSSLSFQWLNNLESSILQTLKTVKNNNNFYFSLIIDGSLKEIKTSCQESGVDLLINNFISSKNLEKMLLDLNFNYQIKYEDIILEYKDLYSILKSMKMIGASYKNGNNFVGKNNFNKISNFYLKNFNLNNKVYATWRVCYAKIHL
jgi:malonyl-CoA O-methyltransferase